MALNVRATPTLSHKWLLPRLGSLIDLDSDLEVRLDGTNEPTDFDRESVDVEIRHGDGRWPGLFVEGLSEEEFWPVCAPAYASAGSLAPSGSSYTPLNPFREITGAVAAVVRSRRSSTAYAMAQGALRSQPYGDRRRGWRPGDRA